MQLVQLPNYNKWYFILLVCLTFSVFLFTSDGHRYSFDEDVIQQQALWIATMTPHDDFILGESRALFQYPEYFPYNTNFVCLNGILCSQTYIGSSLVEIPFIFINQAFTLIDQDTVFFTAEDFGDPHYSYWRNSINPDFTFVELVFGPTISALLVGVFFLVLRSYRLSFSTSIIISLLFAFSTTVWAYSQTSLNVVPAAFFILLGFYFFRKFLISSSKLNLLISSITLGFGFLVRPDSILFIIPLFFYFIFILFQRTIGYYPSKIKNLVIYFPLFVIPLFSSYGLQKFVDLIRFGAGNTLEYVGVINIINPAHHGVTIGTFGMLFAPGVGLFIFAPILLTCFFSFPHFFQKHKGECILFIAILSCFILFYSQSHAWHGLNAWGERYLFAAMPFLLIPLGFSLEKFSSKRFTILLICLGSLGVFFNISYLVNDVSWFIWGLMGSGKGLYELGHIETILWVHPLTLWTFEFSQLTHTIKYLFYSLEKSLQLDIYLLKVLGPNLYSIFFILPTSVLVYFIIRLSRIADGAQTLKH